MNTRHAIKILDTFAYAVWSGDKSFEIRKNDRGYQKGDEVVFEVIEADGHPAPTHPLNRKSYEITYVLSGYGLSDGYCVFGIRPQEGRR